MCPVTSTTLALASLAVTTAGAVTTYVGQTQQADAQAKHQQNLMDQTQENADKAYRQEVSQINRRVIEEQDAAGSKLTENAIGAAKARSRARVSAGESGVSGLSVDALMADFSRQEQKYRYGVQSNLKRTTDQAQMEKKGAATRGQSRVNSAFSSTRPISKPSFLQPALQIGAGGLDTYDRYLKE